MCKTAVAFVTLLWVACVLTFTARASALLAAAGVMSALGLIAVRIPATAGMVPCRARRGAKWLARCVAAGLLVVLVPALLWAGFGTSFPGVVSTIPTPGVTLSNPHGMAVDGLGNIYIADGPNGRIVEVNAAGVASVVAFPGLSPALVQPQAVAVDGSGNLFVADSNNHRIVELSGGVASVVDTGSLLDYPDGLAFNAAGDLFIADANNNYIVKLPAGGVAAVLTITGLGTPINTPENLAVDAAGNLYIPDGGNNRIVIVTPGGAGSVLTITGGLNLEVPLGVAVDRLGNVFIADTFNNRIVKVAPGGAAILVNLGTNTLIQPRAVAVNAAGAVIIEDSGHSRILQAQTTSVGFGHLAFGAVSGTTLALPFSVANGTILSSVQALTLGTANLDFTVVPAGTTCIAGTTGTQSCNVNIQFLPTAAGLRRGAVVLFDNSTPPVPILSVPLYGTGDGPLAALNPGMASVISTGGVATTLPFGIAFDGAGNIYCGNDASNNVIKIPAGGGTGVVVYTSPTADEILGVAVDGAGNLFIADYTGLRIQVLTPAGVLSVLTLNGLNPVLGQPTALAFDAAGNLYIADYTRGRVVKVSSLLVGATSSGTASVLGTGTFTFSPTALTGLAVDAAGTIYLADRASRVVKVTAAGAASLVSLAGVSPAPSAIGGVAVDGNGNLSLVDAGHARIVQVTTAGVASVVQMTGVTNLSPLFGAALDPAGNVYVPDWGHNRIVKVNVAGSTLSFANTNRGAASAAQTATVTNLGDLPLLLAASPTYTPDFSQPTGASNQCLISTSLAAGIACGVSVQFTPQSVGLLSASLVLTDNNLNLNPATQSVAVSGTGLVTADATAVTVSATPNPANIGASIAITAIVTDTATGQTATVPTGGVTFMDTIGSTAISLNGGVAVTLDGAGHAVLSGVNLTGAGTHTITANYAGVVNAFLATSGTVSETITALAATTTTLTASPNPAVTGQPATLTATVSPAPAVTPAGIISFYSGTTLLGTATLNASGVATFTTSGLVVGSDSLTAVYPGDGELAASTSSAVAQTVNASYSVDGPPMPVPIAAGGSVAVNITVPPLGGPFDSAVTLSASGLPPGATAAFNPPTVTPGSAGATTVMTIQLPKQIAGLAPRGNAPASRRPFPFASFSFTLAFAVCGVLGRFRRPKAAGLLVATLALAGATLMFTACNGGLSAGPSTPAGNYKVTVTGTSGAQHISTSFTLAVH